MTPFKKWLLNFLGIACLVIGIVNRFIPGMPTTPFLILSSILFARVNSKMREWLLRNKFVGPYLDNYFNKIGLTTAYKLRTCTFMWSGMFFSVTIIPLLPIQILLPVIGLAVTVHIAMLTHRAPDPAQSGMKYNLITLFMAWIWIGLGLIIASTPFAYLFLAATGSLLTIVILTYGIVTSIRR